MGYFGAANGIESGAVARNRIIAQRAAHGGPPIHQANPRARGSHKAPNRGLLRKSAAKELWNAEG
jgi:hypothetical protein